MIEKEQEPDIAQTVAEPEEQVEEKKPQAVKAVPPDLEILNQSVLFTDEDKNKIINYRESCEIKFRIKNFFLKIF